MGPFPLPSGNGTLTAADRDRIRQQTGVSACVRWRAQWQQRCLTLSGPPSRLEQAKARLAEECIRRNGEEGGRASEPVQPQATSSQMAAVTQKMTKVLEGGLASLKQYSDHQDAMLSTQLHAIQEKLQVVEHIASQALATATAAQAAAAHAPATATHSARKGQGTTTYRKRKPSRCSSSSEDDGSMLTEKKQDLGDVKVEPSSSSASSSEDVKEEEPAKVASPNKEPAEKSDTEKNSPTSPADEVA